MSQHPKRTLSIYSLDEIPDFQSEDEERDWWVEHEFRDELRDSLLDATEELNRIAPLPQGPRRRKRASG
jgi:hypothetical protein